MLVPLYDIVDGLEIANSLEPAQDRMHVIVLEVSYLGKGHALVITHAKMYSVPILEKAHTLVFNLVKPLVKMSKAEIHD
eukprot:9941714-Ditylum_brightwellii.AAC.1